VWLVVWLQSKMLMDLSTYTTMPHIPRSQRFRSKKGGLSLPSGHRASLLATRPLSGRKAIVRQTLNRTSPTC
jgi:hypothetical protein